LALSAYPVESAGNDWDVQQNLPRHPLKIILKDGLSILIRLLQMWAMKAEWNIQGLYFVDGNKGEDLWGVTDHELVTTGFYDCGFK
jgi:hypothetical protein